MSEDTKVFYRVGKVAPSVGSGQVSRTDKVSGRTVVTVDKGTFDRAKRAASAVGKGEDSYVSRRRK